MNRLNPDFWGLRASEVLHITSLKHCPNLDEGFVALSSIQSKGPRSVKPCHILATSSFARNLGIMGSQTSCSGRFIGHRV